MGKMLEKHDWGNNQKKTKKNVCHFVNVLEVVSTRWNIITREEKTQKITIGGWEKKGEFEGKVYKKQETFEPYIYFS
jgi:hypothetical protein